MFMQVSQIFQRRKCDANNEDFEHKLNLTGQAQLTPPPPPPQKKKKKKKKS